MKSVSCPYCGYEFVDSWHLGLNHHGNDIMCPECNAIFHAWCEVTYDYHVRRL